MPRKIDYSLWLEPPDPGPDGEYDILAVARELDKKLPARWRMERWIEITFVPLVIVSCLLSLGALAGLVSGWLLLTFVLALIVLGVFLKRRMRSRPGRGT